MLVARALHDNEHDLLVGYEKQTLVIKDLDGNEVHRRDAPPNGWSHSELEAIDYYSISPEWDAYIGNQWIGSSEV